MKIEKMLVVTPETREENTKILAHNFQNLRPIKWLSHNDWENPWKGSWVCSLEHEELLNQLCKKN